LLIAQVSLANRRPHRSVGDHGPAVQPPRLEPASKPCVACRDAIGRLTTFYDIWEIDMRRFILAGCALLVLGGATGAQANAVGGAAVGAVGGAVVGGPVGAVVGGVGGAVVGSRMHHRHWWRHHHHHD
jgi:hypothetical protein